MPSRPHLAPGLSVQGFFERLRQRDARYVVLRWFEDLPRLDPGEDLDLLIADEHISVLGDLIVRDQGRVRCDAYSVSGLPGSEWKKMAYYPPYLADQILCRARWHNDLCRVPCPEDHFLSLAYHALYHKGPKSGLPTSIQTVIPTADPEHEYARILADLAEKLDRVVSIDMESLDDLLAAEGWRPPIDTLARLSLKNPWVQERFFSEQDEIDPRMRGLVVFIVRRKALDVGLHGLVLEELRASGFQFLATKSISQADSTRIGQRLRGGNWGPGPWPTSGGGPAVAVAAYDLDPQEPPEDLRTQQPHVTNARIVWAKERVRDRVNEKLPEPDRCNVLHSSDNDRQAWEYVQTAMPEHEADLKTQLRRAWERVTRTAAA